MVYTLVLQQKIDLAEDLKTGGLIILDSPTSDLFPGTNQVDQTTFNLWNGQDYVLHISIRRRDNAVVFTTKENGRWGATSSRISLRDNLQSGSAASIMIMDHGDRFQILFNNKTVHYFTKTVAKPVKAISYNTNGGHPSPFSDPLPASSFASLADFLQDRDQQKPVDNTNLDAEKRKIADREKAVADRENTVAIREAAVAQREQNLGPGSNNGGGGPGLGTSPSNIRPADYKFLKFSQSVAWPKATEIETARDGLYSSIQSRHDGYMRDWVRERGDNLTSTDYDYIAYSSGVAWPKALGYALTDAYYLKVRTKYRYFVDVWNAWGDEYYKYM